MDDRAENSTASLGPSRGALAGAEPAGEITSLLDDQNMQTEKLLTVITELTRRLTPILDVTERDRADGAETQKSPQSSVGQGILRNTNNVKQAQGLLSELLHRIQL